MENNELITTEEVIELTDSVSSRLGFGLGFGAGVLLIGVATLISKYAVPKMHRQKQPLSGRYPWGSKEASEYEQEISE